MATHLTTKQLTPYVFDNLFSNHERCTEFETAFDVSLHRQDRDRVLVITGPAPAAKAALSAVHTLLAQKKSFHDIVASASRHHVDKSDKSCPKFKASSNDAKPSKRKGPSTRSHKTASTNADPQSTKSSHVLQAARPWSKLDYVKALQRPPNSTSSYSKPESQTSEIHHRPWRSSQPTGAHGHDADGLMQSALERKDDSRLMHQPAPWHSRIPMSHGSNHSDHNNHRNSPPYLRDHAYQPVQHMDDLTLHNGNHPHADFHHQEPLLHVPVTLQNRHSPPTTQSHSAPPASAPWHQQASASPDHPHNTDLDFRVRDLVAKLTPIVERRRSLRNEEPSSTMNMDVYPEVFPQTTQAARRPSPHVMFDEPRRGTPPFDQHQSRVSLQSRPFASVHPNLPHPAQPAVFDPRAPQLFHSHVTQPAITTHDSMPMPFVTRASAPQPVTSSKRAAAPIHGPVSIFIDHSNVDIGAQMIVPKPGAKPIKDASLCLNVEGLIKLLEEPWSNIERRMVAGSYTLSQVADKYKQVGYQVAVAKSKAFAKEDFVDTAISSDMMQLLLSKETAGGVPGTLVFVSGDGNDNSGLASFVTVIGFALSLGWRVFHWTWRSCLSSNYNRFKQEFPHMYIQRVLDDYRDKVVQMRPGVIYIPTQSKQAQAKPSTKVKGKRNAADRHAKGSIIAKFAQGEGKRASKKRKKSKKKKKNQTTAEAQ
eukprot:TRINITY_DN9186_c0_g1_i1.p1 TRINITY_DN9186_c0_g1~~TRINITY_DN9186_c0_g1_i1.p1  ORF type:complete len:715 (+),score=103.50 TRINITY_DN9186_c0_g1_i1:31-2145(+)